MCRRKWKFFSEEIFFCVWLFSRLFLSCSLIRLPFYFIHALQKSVRPTKSLDWSQWRIRPFAFHVQPMLSKNEAMKMTKTFFLLAGICLNCFHGLEWINIASQSIRFYFTLFSLLLFQHLSLASPSSPSYSMLCVFFLLLLLLGCRLNRSNLWTHPNRFKSTDPLDHIALDRRNTFSFFFRSIF